MEEEVKRLKLEIDVLRKRVSELEKIERKRRSIRIIKALAIIVIIIIIAIYAYKWYDKIMDFYNQVNEFMNNPLKSIL